MTGGAQHNRPAATLGGVEGCDQPGTVPPDFASWYRSQHPRLVAALCAVTQEADVARDAADEAFARSLLDWERVRAMRSPAGWTYRVALNELRRTVRRRGIERRLTARLPPPSPVPEPHYQEVWTLLASLSRRQRTAVVLRYVADLAEADIAVAMGVRRGTVASTLFDAHHRLGALMEPTADSEAGSDA